MILLYDSEEQKSIRVSIKISHFGEGVNIITIGKGR